MGPVLPAGLISCLAQDCCQHDDSDASTTDGSPEDCSSSDEAAYISHNSSSDFEDSPFLLGGCFSNMLARATDVDAAACEGVDMSSHEYIQKDAACDNIRNTF